MTDLYADVCYLRMAIGYFGQDCQECPGVATCRLVYDSRCHTMQCRQDVFPCGLRPQGEYNAALQRTLYRMGGRKTWQCEDCGAVVSAGHTLCASCAAIRRCAREGT